MPLYAYCCRGCARQVEVFLPMADRDHGPACHGPMWRVPSAPRLVNAPTGAAVRSQFRLFQEASQELAHADVDTSHLWPEAKARARGLEADGVTATLP